MELSKSNLKDHIPDSLKQGILNIRCRINLAFGRTNQVQKEVWAVLKDTNIESVTKDMGGFKMKLYTDSMLSGSIYGGYFEVGEQNFVRRFLKPDDIFVDVGSNIGLFSLIAADKVGANGKVVAFEPTQEVFMRLRENVDMNSFNNVELNEMALSDKEEVLTIKVACEGFDAWSSFGTPNLEVKYDFQKVQATTIDEFVKENESMRKARLIKIDVEGWEMRVLDGGEKFLRGDSSPHLLIEFTEVNAENAGTSCKQLYNKLREYGYDMYEISESGDVKSHAPKNRYLYTNLLATKNIDEVRKRIGTCCR